MLSKKPKIEFKKHLNVLKISSFLVIFTLLFVPKVNIITVPGSTIGIRADDLAVVFFVVSLIISAAVKRQKYFDLFSKKMVACYAAFIVVSVISSLVNTMNGNVELGSSLVYTARFIEYLVVLPAGAILLKNGVKKDSLVHLFTAAIFFNLVICILQQKGFLLDVQSGITYKAGQVARPSAVFNASFEICGVFMMLIPIYLTRFKNTKSSLFNIIPIIAIAAIVYISQSRSSLVIIALIIVIYALATIRQKIMVLIAMVALIVAGIAGIYVFNNLSPKSRMNSVSSENTEYAIKNAWNNRDFSNFTEEQNKLPGVFYKGDPSLNIRLMKWFTITDGAVKSPAVGIGPSFIKIALDGAYLRLFAETGVLGLIFYVAALILSFKAIPKKSKYRKIIFYIFLITAAHAIFIDVFYSSRVMSLYWIMTGMCIYLARVEKKETKTHEKAK